MLDKDVTTMKWYRGSIMKKYNDIYASFITNICGPLNPKKFVGTKRCFIDIILILAVLVDRF